MTLYRLISSIQQFITRYFNIETSLLIFLSRRSKLTNSYKSLRLDRPFL